MGMTAVSCVSDVSLGFLQMGFHLMFPGASWVGMSILIYQRGTEMLSSLPKVTQEQAGLE